MGFYDRLVDGFARTLIGKWTFFHVFTPLDRRLMRWSNGTLSSALGTYLQGNVVLLRCTGAKSGKPRDIPLLAKPLDDGWVLVASAGGQEKSPAWYYNLRAHPHCSLLVPHRGEIACIAREAEGAERDHAWQAANTQYSGYTVYQQRTQRRIPVMILAPEKQT
jgi:deazaflavin-dependent oxidoreductase (nitroreductase family)